MNDDQASMEEAESSSWGSQVANAVIATSEGFLRRLNDTSESRERAHSGPTTNPAIIRAWLYRDIHVKAESDIASYIGYSKLPISTALRRATIKDVGWRLEGDRLVHGRRALSLTPRDVSPDGFAHADGEVEIPRLRCGTAPGWLTVSGMRGRLTKRSHRLYLPGIGLGEVEALVSALDSIPTPVAWSLKSSLGVDRDGVEVARADRTVVYVEIPARTEGASVCDLLDVLATHASNGPGPGFSVPLRPGVHFGGQGNEHGSFGTKMAAISATALLGGDLSPVERAERDLGARAARFEAGEER